MRDVRVIKLPLCLTPLHSPKHIHTTLPPSPQLLKNRPGYLSIKKENSNKKLKIKNKLAIQTIHNKDGCSSLWWHGCRR